MTSNQPEWIRAARQFGAEVVANGGRRPNPNADEREDIAYYHPAGKWASMSKEDQEAARKAFAEGVQAEMKNHA